MSGILMLTGTRQYNPNCIICGAHAGTDCISGGCDDLCCPPGTPAIVQGMARDHGLSARAMLVDLTIKQWSGTKAEKRIVADAAATYGANAGMLSASKRLMTAPAFVRIREHCTAVYAEHRRRTLPWFDSGARILSAVGYFDYTEYMRLAALEFDSLVDAFCGDYPRLVADAQAQYSGLGALAHAGDWPDVGRLRGMYSLGYSVMPFPDSRDLRLDIGDAELARLAQSVDAMVSARVAGAHADIAARIGDVVGHMAESLRGYTGGRAGAFRDSLTGNVRALADILPTLNITDDPDLASVISDIRSRLCAPEITADALRDSDVLRERVAQDADAILSKMAAFV